MKHLKLDWKNTVNTHSCTPLLLALAAISPNDISNLDFHFMKFYILFFPVRKSRNWDSGADETQSFNAKYNLWCNSRRVIYGLKFFLLVELLQL